MWVEVGKLVVRECWGAGGGVVLGGCEVRNVWMLFEIEVLGWEILIIF